MKGSKNNIENRSVTEKKHCSICNEVIKNIKVIQSGKGRIIKVCKCSLYY